MTKGKTDKKIIKKYVFYKKDLCKKTDFLKKSRIVKPFFFQSNKND